MTYSTIRMSSERAGDGVVATLTLHRPEVRNAINKQMIVDLGDPGRDNEGIRR